MELMKTVVRERHNTLIMVTHDNNLASIADKIIRIVDGQIVEVIENKKEEVAN